MKFSFVSSAIALSIAVFSQSVAATYHCGGPHNLVCPTNWRCCGPIIDGVGGTCFEGATGLCPL
ncbi:hypothetical protein BJ912DRAFT_1141283 [Pholiota molesta]|nr:hypothetical protein BJ912DRAFT_1141283 [Pholiota molesta]